MGVIYRCFWEGNNSPAMYFSHCRVWIYEDCKRSNGVAEAGGDQ